MCKIMRRFVNMIKLAPVFLMAALSSLGAVVLHKSLPPKVEPEQCEVCEDCNASIRSLEQELKVCFSHQDRIYDTVNKDKSKLAREKIACDAMNRKVLNNLLTSWAEVASCKEKLNTCVNSSTITNIE